MNRRNPTSVPTLAMLLGLVGHVLPSVAQPIAPEASLGELAQAACVGLAASDACEVSYQDQVYDGSCRALSGDTEGALLCLPSGVGSGLSYPVVDSGQTGCYADHGAEIACPPLGEALTGQDAQHAGNAAVRIDRGDGTVSDLVTGLMWQQSPDTNGDGTLDATDELTYEAALSYCEDLGLAGHRDWRLPEIKALYSLIDFNGIDPNAESTDSSGLKPFIDDSVFDFA